MPALDLVPAPDEHNPIGSNFRPDQTRALYGYTPRLVSAADVVAQRPQNGGHAPLQKGASEKPLAPILHLVPRVQMPLESLSFELSDLEKMPLSSRRLALVCATRIIERAQSIEGDGATRESLAFYVGELKDATKNFEKSIAPKSGLHRLFERLFED